MNWSKSLKESSWTPLVLLWLVYPIASFFLSQWVMYARAIIVSCFFIALFFPPFTFVLGFEQQFSQWERKTGRQPWWVSKLVFLCEHYAFFLCWIILFFPIINFNLVYCASSSQYFYDQEWQAGNNTVDQSLHQHQSGYFSPYSKSPLTLQFKCDKVHDWSHKFYASMEHDDFTEHSSWGFYA